MIAGTDFFFEDFEVLWSMLAPRAERWIKAEVLSEIRQDLWKGHALCLANRDGLIVIGTSTIESGKMRCNVLLAVSTGTPGAFMRHEPSMLKIARDLNADELSFRADRTGWPRVLGPEWSLQGEVFVRNT
jgi:hypothetical protein